MPPKRVAVFVDYQNVYMGARDAFFSRSALHTDGQVHPGRLGIKLAVVGDDDRELVATRVYRGQPSWKHDAVGAAAADRQVALWKQQALVEVITRPINYRDPAKPKEKGIDVRLAIDMVTMAGKDYDIGILFSSDTDLLPALEAIIASHGADACETAAWMPPSGETTMLRVSGHTLRVHDLTQRDYGHVQDTVDYNAKRRRR